MSLIVSVDAASGIFSGAFVAIRVKVYGAIDER
jgi:hypothetical protein